MSQERLTPSAPAPQSPARPGRWRGRSGPLARPEWLRPLIEPILHPSPSRVRALGMSILVGHPLFYVIWAVALPQPYENLPLRLLMAALGLALLVIPGITSTLPHRASAMAVSTIFWITLPWYFGWMYVCNSGSPVWLASLGAMFLIYYQLTDWRLATAGSISGLAVAWLMFVAWGPPVMAMAGDTPAVHAVVLAFCWVMALILGLSSSNLRRQQLEYTLGTMGIMAHELRTPLATMQLIGDALRSQATANADAPQGAELAQLAQRLHNVVRNMNHQIDMQITNARLLRVRGQADLVSAARLVQDVVADYPFRTPRERDGVAVTVRGDFHFRGSRQLFAQVLNNLIKNALRALAAAPAASGAGLRIDVATDARSGTIVVADQGIGMDVQLQARIFQPFFSTDRGTGHGLGLAFCQRVVDSAGGTMGVRSAPREGAVFTIELPLA